jgi:hypothetical protein
MRQDNIGRAVNFINPPPGVKITKTTKDMECSKKVSSMILCIRRF